MSTNKEKTGTQNPKPQRPDNTNHGFGKSPSGFPEEPREQENPDKLHTPGKTPVGGTPTKSREPVKLPGNDKEAMTQRNPEEKDNRDTHNTGKAWSPATNPDEHGTAQQKKNLKEGSTTPDPTEEEETTDPARRAPEREGQQEKETQLPETPPSEWEVKSGAGRTAAKQTPEAKEKSPAKTERPAQEDAQDKQRRGL